MKVLVACEFSGIVRDTFIAKGHDAVSCDLLPTEKPGPHIQGDVIDVLDPFNEWDLMIAHPPCTYLCSSGLHWNHKRPARAAKTEAALEFVNRLLDAPVLKIALENPIGCISSRIRKPEQIIQPYWFGENASKQTCLWLKNLPQLWPTDKIEGQYGCSCGYRFAKCLGKYGCPNCEGGGKVREIWGNQTPTGQNKLGPSDTRAKDRSRTFQGIADAMAEQWG